MIWNRLWRLLFPYPDGNTEELPAEKVESEPIQRIDAEALAPEEWALAIVVAYESGNDLTEEAKSELRRSLANPRLKNEIRLILISQGYGDIFGLRP